MFTLKIKIIANCSQDFTGVPAVVDLACMRDAMNRLGGDSNKINPLVSYVWRNQSDISSSLYVNASFFVFFFLL